MGLLFVKLFNYRIINKFGLYIFVLCIILISKHWVGPSIHFEIHWLTDGVFCNIKDK